MSKGLGAVEGVETSQIYYQSVEDMFSIKKREEKEKI